MTRTFVCAQFGDHVGDVNGAIELYQWFLDNTVPILGPATPKPALLAT